VDIGSNQRLSIGGEQSESVAQKKVVSVGTTYDLSAGEGISLGVGDAKITLFKSGKVKIEGGRRLRWLRAGWPISSASW
jgi:hypothetical protein